MKSFTVASVNRLSELAGFRGLLANNGRLAKGDLEEKRTPFFAGRDPLNVLETTLEAVSGTQFDDLEKVEYDKAGPYRRSPYADYKSKVHGYYSGHSALGAGESRALVLAVSKLSAYLRSRMSIVASQTDLDAAYKRSRKNTNLGLPYLTNRWEPKVIGNYLGRAKRLLEGGNVLYPFTLFHRSQPKSFTTWSDRVVFGADHAETFGGLTVLPPAIESLRDIPGFEGWKGTEAVEARAAQIFARKRFYVSTDFSGYDSTIGPEVMKAAFDVIALLFDSRLNEKFLARMLEYYTLGELVTPEGLIQGLHGLPSGVSWTNLIGTLVQLLMLTVTCSVLGIELETLDFMFLGDDGVIAFEDSVDAKVHYRICESFGLVVNEDKSSESEDSFSFLQRHFRRDLVVGNYCPGVYSCLRTVARLIWTERNGFKIDDEIISSGEESFIKYDAGFWVLVAYMKLENAKRHPKFRELVKIAVRGDRYGLDPNLIGRRVDNIDSIKGYDTGSTVPRSGGLMAFESVRVAIEVRAEMGLS